MRELGAEKLCFVPYVKEARLITAYWKHHSFVKPSENNALVDK